MNLSENKALHIEGENGVCVQDVVSQIPNNTMKKFYIKKLNTAIKEVLIPVIDLKNLIEDNEIFNSEKTSIDFITGEIFEIERKNYEELSKTPILCILKMSVSSIIQKTENIDEYKNIHTLSKDIMSIISEWVDIDDKIREVEISSIYTLYEYIQDEEIKEKTLIELKSFYEEMF